jgi:hypothetical protein
MFDQLNQLFSGPVVYFSIPAVAGTVFFALRLVLMFAGIGGDHHDVAADAAHSPDLDAAGADPHHSTALFKFLSVQGIAAFLMGFGWGGVGGMLGARWDFGSSLVSALVGGIAMMWLLSWLLKMVYDLQSTGTVPIQAALDAEGEVYVTVPRKGQGLGQVRVIIQDRQRVYNAISDFEAIPTNTRVRVMRINDDNTITVAAV